MHINSLKFNNLILYVHSKGQLISKGLCGIPYCPKKRTKNSTLLLWYLRSTCFCSVFRRNWRHQKDISKLTIASDKWHHETSADVIWACKTTLYLKLSCFLFLLCGVTYTIYSCILHFQEYFNVLQLLENRKKVGYIWHFLLNFFTK